VGLEGEGDDAIVTDELLDDDYVDMDAGIVEAVEPHDHEEANVSGDGDQERAGDVNGGGEKVSRKRSRSHSKSPPESHEKDDFDDEELDSDVDETGGVTRNLSSHMSCSPCQKQ